MSRREQLRFALALTFVSSLFACASKEGAPSAQPVADATRVTLTYLGTAGWQLDDGPHTLLIDPYFSRIDVDDSDAKLTPDLTAVARYAPQRVDAILVGHSHYDHLLDVPEIAMRSGAFIVGSRSTLNVATAAGVPAARLLPARGGESFEFGPFTVQVFRGAHSLTGQSNLGVEIPPLIVLPLSANSYAEGGTLQYLVRMGSRSVLFIGSANFLDSELHGLRPDVAVVAVALREKVPDYSCRLMNALGRPGLVFTNHFDAHWEPLGAHQMDLDDSSRQSLARFGDEVRSCSPHTKVVVPVHLKPMSI